MLRSTILGGGQRSLRKSHGLEIRGWKVPTFQGTEELFAKPLRFTLNVASTAGFS